VRTAADAVFDPVRARAQAEQLPELELFYGNREHRVLGADESLAELVAQAGREALRDAGRAAGEVDRLYGALSLSEYLAPSELYRVHDLLGLRRELLTVPVQGEFTNFVMALLLAWEALRAGHCRCPLIAVGAGWTRNADYRLGNAYGLGDGAAAAVLGPSDSLVPVDWEARTLGSQYRAMTMRHRPESGLDHPTFRLEPEAGVQTFLSLGMDGAPELVARLLARHGLDGGDITFVGHQASRKLMDHWNERIRPRAYLDTLEDCGNLLFASVPVTLSRHRRLQTPYLVLYGIGIGSVADVALLLKV
jgi:3-oxoacyl-[acyl-carrier-protein] synthase-3